MVPFVTKRLAHNDSFIAPAFENEDEADKFWVEYFSHKKLPHYALRAGLNEIFRDEAVPEPEILKEALYAARRLNDFAIAMRTVEAIRHKAENKEVYEYVMAGVKPVMEELGIPEPEELGLDKYWSLDSLKTFFTEIGMSREQMEKAGLGDNPRWLSHAEMANFPGKPENLAPPTDVKGTVMAMQNIAEDLAEYKARQSKEDVDAIQGADELMKKAGSIGGGDAKPLPSA